MCLKVSFRSGAGSQPARAARVFQLAPMELVRADERGVAYRPSARDFTARVILGLICLLFAAAAYGLAWMGENNAVEPGVDETPILVLKVIAGAIVVGVAAWLMSWPWTRFRITSDKAGNLLVKNHGWFRRKWTYPFADLRRIAYGLKQEPVYSTPIQSTGGSRLVAAPWVWYIRLEFGRASESGRPWPVKFNLYSGNQSPGPKAEPPQDVVALGKWLHAKTGMPIERMPNEPYPGAERIGA